MSSMTAHVQASHPAASDPAACGTGWRLLTIPDFRWLWLGQAVSQIGEGLNKVALLYLVYEVTGSTLMMTVIGVLQTLPPLLLGPLLGVYVDRLPKKWMMMGADALRAALALIIPVLYAVHAFTLPRTYVVVFLMALVATVFSPALSSTVPLIVGPTQLTAANAWVASTAMIGMLVGPAISGLGIATVGMQVVLYVSSATFALSVLSLSQLRLKQAQAQQGSNSRKTFLKDLREGLRFVFVKKPTVAGLVLAAISYSLAASAFVFLLPVFAEKVLHVNALMLAWLWSAYGAGMLVVSLVLACMKQYTPSVRLRFIVAAMVVGGAASYLLGVTNQTPLALGLVAIIGASLASFTPVVWGLLQEMTPEELRGRVFSVLNTGAMSASMLGMVGFGWTADRLGPVMSLTGMTAVFAVTAGVILLLGRFGDWKSRTA
jgi:DHA3 family macrolide efflux protein-like MFS transporter